MKFKVMNLLGEKVDMRTCPRCRKQIRVWVVINKLYGFCDNCVEGFYYDKIPTSLPSLY